MALKAKVPTLEGLDDSVKALYTKQADGSFALDVEDSDNLPSFSGLKSAFEKNKESLKELKAKLEGLEGITPEQVKNLMEQARKNQIALRVKGKEIKTEDDINSVVEELLGDRVNEATKEWTRKETSYNERIGKLESRLSATQIDAVILDAAAKSGVRKTATADVLARARQVWKLTDDAPVPMNGDKIIYGKEANKPMTAEEWVTKLAEDAPHLFEGSSGGGAGGNGGGGGGSGGQRFQGSKIIYSKEDLAAGRADINKIAAGEAVIEG